MQRFLPACRTLNVVAHDQSGQSLVIDAGGCGCRDLLPIPQDREGVGDTEDLLQVVGDDDDAVARLLELADGAEESLDVAFRQGGRGLVEDEHHFVVLPIRERPGDGKAGPVGHAELPDRCAHVDLQTGPGHQVSGDATGVSPPDPEPHGCRVAATQHQVLHRAQLKHQAEVLMHEPDAETVGVCRRADLQWLTVNPGRSTRVGGVITSQDLDQGRLARSVLTDQAVHLTFADQDPDPVQHDLAAEGLREVANHQSLPGRGVQTFCGTLNLVGGTVGVSHDDLRLPTAS